MNKTKNGKMKSWLMVVAPIVAAVLFVGIFLTVERKALSSYETIEVVTAKTEILAGTQVTQENLESLFTTTQMKAEYVIDQATTTKETLVGCVVENTIHAKEMISTKDVTHREKWKNNLTNPIEFTFTASSVAASVGGTIRGGDAIDVGIMVQAADGSSYFTSIGRDIYVKDVYNDKGVSVPRTDQETVCTMFRVVMERSQGEVFIEQLRNGEEVIVTLPGKTKGEM